MARIDVILPGGPARQWQIAIAERLTDAGYDVAVVRDESAKSQHLALDLILTFEAHFLRSRGNCLSSPVDASKRDVSGRPGSQSPADLVIDLTGSKSDCGAPTLRLTFDGSPCFANVAQVLATGGLPRLSISIDGRTVGEAAPMVDSRVLVARGMEDVLARSITAVMCSVDRFFGRRSAGNEPEPATVAGSEPPTGLALAGSYLGSTLPRLVGRAVRKLRYRDQHWRVGYRFLDGPGVAQSHSLDGPAWSILPDDGRRYFADPFPFEWQGRHFIFVEEYPYATGKGVISVAEFDAEGAVLEIARVLEEPFHMSYPNVFARDGAIWMMPEGGAGHNLLLYKAEEFPHRWTRHCVMIGDQKSLRRDAPRPWRSALDFRQPAGQRRQCLGHARRLPCRTSGRAVAASSDESGSYRPQGRSPRRRLHPDQQPHLPAPPGRYPLLRRRAWFGGDCQDRRDVGRDHVAEADRPRRAVALSDDPHAQSVRPTGDYRRHRRERVALAVPGRAKAGAGVASPDNIARHDSLIVALCSIYKVGNGHFGVTANDAFALPWLRVLPDPRSLCDEGPIGRGAESHGRKEHHRKQRPVEEAVAEERPGDQGHHDSDADRIRQTAQGSAENKDQHHHADHALLDDDAEEVVVGVFLCPPPRRGSQAVGPDTGAEKNLKQRPMGDEIDALDIDARPTA